MASYKIYFLDFCHKNHPPREEKWHSELQNASVVPCFMKKEDFVPILGLKSSVVAVEHFQFSQPHMNPKVPKVPKVLNVWSL